MNSKAFFSIFVAAFAVIFLISLFYAQSVQFETQSRAAELGVLQQALSKDWFMARNALANFASDAMLTKIQLPDPPNPSVNCTTAHFSATDYGPDINDYWHSAILYMNAKFGTQCDVNLSGDIKFLMENSPTPNEYHGGERAYGLLSCTRSTPHATLTIKRPFVIRKEVTLKYTGPPTNWECDMNVFDILGDNPAGGVVFRKQDANKFYHK